MASTETGGEQPLPATGTPGTAGEAVATAPAAERPGDTPEEAAGTRGPDAPAAPDAPDAPAAPDGPAAPDRGAGKDRRGKDRPGQDLAGLEAGLDALDAVQVRRRAPVTQVLLQKVLPPVVAVLLVLGIWKALVVAEVTDDYKLPDPSLVWQALRRLWLEGELLDIVWTSVSRGMFGFLMALAIATPLGLIVARVKFVRAAIGPILSGLQSLPSVAWVPPAVIWLGLNDQMMYAVILLGAVPSITNGLVSGVDQVPPLFLRAGRTLGASGLSNARHVLLPAALPGYVAGLKQGWAFAWRSLMAAEIIVKSPDLGLGLGQYLENQRNNSDMAGVLLGIMLILVVGIAIELLVFAPLERRVLRSRGLIGAVR